MVDEHLMTDEEFRAAVKRWCDHVRSQAKANAAGFAKGKKRPHTYTSGRYSGKTEYKLKDKVGYLVKNKMGDVDHISFKIPVHGIFREYGVGNGQPRGGVATKSGRAVSGRTYIKRSMSDWIHNPIERNLDSFGDLVADYYGDKMLVAFRGLG